jgi:hypothetical protein
LHRLTLTPAAIERLALKSAKIERKPMQRQRLYGGEVIVPVGQAIVVCAPISGLLKAADKAPLPGQNVTAGQPILQLLPLLTPEGRANLAASKTDADGLVNSAQTQKAAATIALQRAERVYRSEAGSRRAVDEAQAQVDLANKALEAAVARRDLLTRVVGEVENGTTAPLAIPAPEDGLLRSVSALPGQNVPAGAPLFEVIDLKRVWVRVPVYVGDLPTIDAQAAASVGDLSASSSRKPWSAQPAIAPPAANAAAGTVDLIYALDNQEADFSPSQRVAVSLPLKDEAESLTAPWSAVVIDIYGGTWVYERLSELEFLRRKVSVRYVAGDTAVLATGPPAGTSVVIAGAAELFGAETGFTK